MATFLVRLPDDGMEALRAAANDQQRSMNELVRDGIRQAIDNSGGREERIRTLTRRIMAEDAGLLGRLADA